MQIQQPQPHKLKEKVRKKDLNLRQLCKLVNKKGIDETKMSRFLNGYYPMPTDVEVIIEEAVK